MPAFSDEELMKKMDFFAEETKKFKDREEAKTWLVIELIKEFPDLHKDHAEEIAELIIRGGFDKNYPKRKETGKYKIVTGEMKEPFYAGLKALQVIRRAFYDDTVWTAMSLNDQYKFLNKIEDILKNPGNHRNDDNYKMMQLALAGDTKLEEEALLVLGVLRRRRGTTTQIARMNPQRQAQRRQARDVLTYWYSPTGGTSPTPTPSPSPSPSPPISSPLPSPTPSPTPSPSPSPYPTPTPSPSPHPTPTPIRLELIIRSMPIQGIAVKMQMLRNEKEIKRRESRKKTYQEEIEKLKRGLRLIPRGTPAFFTALRQIDFYEDAIALIDKQLGNIKSLSKEQHAGRTDFTLGLLMPDNSLGPIKIEIENHFSQNGINYSFSRWETPWGPFAPARMAAPGLGGIPQDASTGELNINPQTGQPYRAGEYFITWLEFERLPNGMIEVTLMIPPGMVPPGAAHPSPNGTIMKRTLPAPNTAFPPLIAGNPPGGIWHPGGNYRVARFEMTAFYESGEAKHEGREVKNEGGEAKHSMRPSTEGGYIGGTGVNRMGRLAGTGTQLAGTSWSQDWEVKDISLEAAINTGRKILHDYGEAGYEKLFTHPTRGLTARYQQKAENLRNLRNEARRQERILRRMVNQQTGRLGIGQGGVAGMGGAGPMKLLGIADRILDGSTGGGQTVAQRDAMQAARDAMQRYFDEMDRYEKEFEKDLETASATLREYLKDRARILAVTLSRRYKIPLHSETQTQLNAQLEAYATSYAEELITRGNTALQGFIRALRIIGREGNTVGDIWRNILTNMWGFITGPWISGSIVLFLEALLILFYPSASSLAFNIPYFWLLGAIGVVGVFALNMENSKQPLDWFKHMIAGGLIALGTIIFVAAIVVTFTSLDWIAQNQGWFLIIWFLLATFVGTFQFYQTGDFQVIFQLSIIILLFGYIALGPYSGYYEQVTGQVKGPVSSVWRIAKATGEEMWILLTNPTEYMTRQQVKNVRSEKPLDFPRGIEINNIEALPPNVPKGEEFFVAFTIRNDGDMPAENIGAEYSCNKYCTAGTPISITQNSLKPGEGQIIWIENLKANKEAERRAWAEYRVAKVKINISYTYSTNTSIDVKVMSQVEMKRLQLEGKDIFQPKRSEGKLGPASISLNVGPQPLRSSDNSRLLVSILNNRDDGTVVLPAGTKIRIRLPPSIGDNLVCPGVTRAIDSQTIEYEVRNTAQIEPNEFKSIYSFVCRFRTNGNVDVSQTDIITAQLNSYIFKVAKEKDVSMTPPLGIYSGGSNASVPDTSCNNAIVKDHMEEFKTSWEPRIDAALLNIYGIAPEEINKVKAYVAARLWPPARITPTGGLSDKVPLYYRTAFIKASASQGAPPALIAAIFACGEHGGTPQQIQANTYSWPVVPRATWTSSFMGAAGPFQFMPCTWTGNNRAVCAKPTCLSTDLAVQNGNIPMHCFESNPADIRNDGSGLDGNGDGRADVQNMDDAAHAASKMLKRNMDVASGSSEQRIRSSIFRYNNDNSYVDRVYRCYSILSVSDPTPTTIEPSPTINPFHLTTQEVQSCLTAGVNINSLTCIMIVLQSSLQGGNDWTIAVNGNIAAEGFVNWNECFNQRSMVGLGTLIWPTPGNRLTSCFGAPRNPPLTTHKGLDIGANIININGDEIRAIADGKVISVDDSCPTAGGLSGCSPTGSGRFGWGKNVVIDHTDLKLFSRYSHLQSISMRPDTFIKQGDLVGLMGISGSTFGTHLDIEIYKDRLSTISPDTRQNPCDYLDCRGATYDPGMLPCAGSGTGAVPSATPGTTPSGSGSGTGTGSTLPPGTCSPSCAQWQECSSGTCQGKTCESDDACQYTEWCSTSCEAQGCPIRTSAHCCGTNGRCDKECYSRTITDCSQIIQLPADVKCIYQQIQVSPTASIDRCVGRPSAAAVICRPLTEPDIGSARYSPSASNVDLIAPTGAKWCTDSSANQACEYSSGTNSQCVPTDVISTAPCMYDKGDGTGSMCKGTSPHCFNQACIAFAPGCGWNSGVETEC